MTNRTPNQTQQRRPRGRARLLAAALAVTGLALIAASPGAIYRDYDAPMDEPAPTRTRTVDNTNETAPVDENGKKSCAYAKFGGGTGYYPHGTKITVTLPNGASKTVTCTDGEWVVSMTAAMADYQFEADDAYVDPSGAFTLVNPHEDYSYSASGGYAAP